MIKNKKPYPTVNDIHNNIEFVCSFVTDITVGQGLQEESTLHFIDFAFQYFIIIIIIIIIVIVPFW